MKRIIAVLAGILALAAGSLWLVSRRQPAGSLLDEPASPFTLEAASQGWRVGFMEGRMPLRALHWLAPHQPGVLVVQVQTQSDRQVVALFRAGAVEADLQVARPQGVGEGFWRYAQLQDAYLAPAGTLVLLYRTGDPAISEPSLAMALDPGAPEARWVHRGTYDHMAVGGTGADQAVFLYGPRGPVQRLALAGTSRRPTAKDIELPPELTEVEDLLPTSAWTFLASTPKGLSAYLGSKGWLHYPLPGPPEGGIVACAGWRSALAQGGKHFWWQPQPGRLVQVGQDGGFPPDDALARDARLLRLLGADPSGNLWFGLAMPAPAPAPAEGQTPPPAEDWGAYAAQGLDRVYRWTPDQERLARFQWSQAWTTLQPPRDVAAATPVLHPASGTCLIEGNRAAWWLPLGALPFRNVKDASQ